MMMNRKRIGRVMAVVAIVLAAFFLLSSILLGLGSSASYNLFDLIGNSGQQQQSAPSSTPDDAIAQAERDLEQNPKDPDAITDLAGAYYTAGRYDDAVRVLKDGRQAAPQNAEIAAFLGSVYAEQAAGVEPKEQKQIYADAGDAFAAASEIEAQNEDYYLQAGQAYEQADQPGEAIEYYNGYLDQEPNGQEADAVEGRISALLEGGGSTTSSQP